MTNVFQTFRRTETESVVLGPEYIICYHLPPWLRATSLLLRNLLQNTEHRGPRTTELGGDQSLATKTSPFSGE